MDIDYIISKLIDETKYAKILVNLDKISDIDK